MDLLIDLDDTILDFHKAEAIALSKTLQTFGLPVTDEVLTLYSQINKAHWEALERKELTREQVLTGRFEVLFRRMGKTVDPVAVARCYETNLSQGHYFMPGALEALQALSKKHRLFVVSNGTKRVQDGRLDSAGIRPFFADIFISQEIGVNKPDALFFARCFERIPGFQKRNALIVGDSLSSDILGGKNAGIPTCWVNPKGKAATTDCQPDYEISGLFQLEELLEKL